MDRGAVRRRPCDDPTELSVKGLWLVDKCVDEAGLQARAGVDEQVQAVVPVGRERVEEVVATAKIPESALLPAQGVGYRVPRRRFEFGRGKTAADQTHAAPAVADGEASPVRLAREHGSAGGQGRLSRARVRKEHDLLCVEVMW